MSERLKRVERVVHVLDLVEKSQTAKLTSLQVALDANEAAKSDAVSALDVDSPLHGMMTNVIATRLRTLDRDAKKLVVERDKAAAELMHAASRAKAAGRLLERVSIDARITTERRQSDERSTASAEQYYRKV